MAKFNELIKSYDKIRDYLREFLLHGYKQRGDFTKKSARTYDNERRRIENYLPKYISGDQSAKGKRLYISSGAIDMEENPLFASWQSKSFTKNDIMLHFILIDILMDGFWLNINEISDIIVSEYLSVFGAPRIPDVMTVRNKLNEYVSLGLFEKKKDGKTMVYRLVEDQLIRGPVRTEQDMMLACRYFQNTLPVGVIGHFVLNQYLDNQRKGIFSFRHQFIAQTLDEEILVTIFQAIRDHKNIMVDIKTKNQDGGSIRVKILPLAVLNNLASGRRYLAIYRYRGKVYDTIRIDKIVDCSICDRDMDTSQHKKMLRYHLDKAWGVSINKGKPLEHLSITLRVDEKNEMYIIDRLNREGRQGTVEKIGENMYEYAIDIADVSEMMPWIRTFTGRIISMECSNEMVKKRFYKDIASLSEMYKEELDVI